MKLREGRKPVADEVALAQQSPTRQPRRWNVHILYSGRQEALEEAEVLYRAAS